MKGVVREEERDREKTEWSSPVLQGIADFCVERTGLVSLRRRMGETEAAIRHAMERLGISRTDEYLHRLREDPRLLDDLVEQIVVGETYFFREPEALEFLRSSVFPSLAEFRGAEHVLRIWSAGCASGEEPYTLAILASESEWHGRVRILGTDISRIALARAGQGEYSAWSLRATSAEAAARWFRRSGTRHVLADRCRKAVEFRYLNLAADSYPDLATGTSGIDVVFCRNVLMYFPREVVERVAQRFFRSLLPGGWLITGATDPPVGSFAPFNVVVTEAGVFYQRPLETAGVGVKCPVVLDQVRQSNGADSGVGAKPSDALASPGPSVRGASDVSGPGPAWSDPPSQSSGVASGADGAGGAMTGVASLDEAHRLFRAGEMEPTLAVLERLLSTPESLSLQVQALANTGRTDEALALVRKSASRFPSAPHIRFLLAMLLFQKGRTAEAATELRKTLYLDHEAALPHFFHGLMLQRSGRMAGARRAFRNAFKLASRQPEDSVIAYSEEQLAGNLAEAAAAQLAVVERMLEGNG